MQVIAGSIRSGLIFGGISIGLAAFSQQTPRQRAMAAARDTDARLQAAEQRRDCGRVQANWNPGRGA